MMTLCAEGNVPLDGEITGVAAGGGCVPAPAVKVQVRMSWTALCPPVAAVKPTYPTVPTVAGILIGQLVVKLAFVDVSTMVIASVAPSYVMWTWKISVVCRLTPPPSVVAGTVGAAPFV